MTFRARLAAVCAALAVLIVLFVVGTLFSPERVQARTAARPLLAGVLAQKIDGIEIMEGSTTAVQLRKEVARVARTGAYPVSADRVATFLRTVAGLRRTSQVTSDPQHLGELGLGSEGSRTLVLHQAGAPDAVLQVGKRGPAGDADYVRVRGEDRVYLARGSLSFFLSQKLPYWYELHVLPDDVQGTTISEITVSGALETLRGGYTLRRPSADKLDQWMVGDSAADRVTAGAMASSLANLEGADFLESGSGSGTGRTGGKEAGRLVIAVKTFEGKAYRLFVSRGTEPGKVRVTADWSPWTYVVNAVAMQRAVLSEASPPGALDHTTSMQIRQMSSSKSSPWRKAISSCMSPSTNCRGGSDSRRISFSLMTSLKTTPWEFFGAASRSPSV